MRSSLVLGAARFVSDFAAFVLRAFGRGVRSGLMLLAGSALAVVDPTPGSVFTSDAEGWNLVSFTNLSTNNYTVGATYAPTFTASGGSPGGYIASNDPDAGDSTFSAPAAYLGNRTASIGATLTYQLIHLIGALNYQAADVILVGNGVRLVWKRDPALAPDATWTTVTVPLAPTAQWKVGATNGALATPADFQSVLGNLTGLYIRSEYTDGAETTGLDNVVLGVAVPGTPAINSISSATVVTGATVTLTGSGFTGATAVSFGGTASISFTVVSDLTITAVVPAGAASGNVTVTSPVGTSTTTVSVTVVAPPVVASVSPTVAVPGALVTITGTNFTSMTGVTFNGTAAASFTVASATQITATVPAGATSGPVVVSISGATSAASATVAIPKNRYTFNNGAVTDSIGTDHGTLVNGAALGGGRLALDGVDDHVQFGVQLVPTGGAFTVAMFAQQTSVQGGFRELISQGQTGSTGFYLGHDASHNIRVGDSWVPIGVAFPSDGLLHHYAVTADATNTRLYVDGVLVASKGSAISMAAGGDNTRLGAQFQAIGEYFQGTIDEVWIFGSALTAGDIAVLATAVPQTRTVKSDATTLAAATTNSAVLDTGVTSGLTFVPAAVGSFGTGSPVPPGAPAGTTVVNIPPGDGSSGFFKATFTLPANFTFPQISGGANMDDAGRVFLNGNPLTPSMSSGSPGIVTHSGNATFASANAAFFVPGVNVLLVSVNNSGGGPSGGSFFANVFFQAAAPSAPLFSTPPFGQTVSVGATAKFSVGATGTPVLTYQWQRQPAGTTGFVNLANGGAYAGVTTGTLTVSGVTAAMLGDQFRCVVSDGLNPNATSDPALLSVAAGSGIVGISIPVNSHDGTSRSVIDGIWSVAAPPYPLDQRGIGAIVKPTWISSGDSTDFTLHDHVYTGSNVPDPARAVVTFAFSTPTVVNQLEVIQHANGVTRIECFVGDSLDALVSIGNVFGSAGDIAGSFIFADGVAHVFQFTNTTPGRYCRVIVRKTSLTNGWAVHRIFPRDAAGQRILGVAATASLVPIVSAISPTVLAAGATVTVTGSGFSGATTVKFNGVNAAAFIVTSDTSITAIVPAGATSGPVTVATAGGTSGSGVVLTVNAPTNAVAAELVTRVPTSMEPQAASGTINRNRRMTSDDGRYVLFTSTSPRLVAGQTDSNGAYDIFRWDRTAGTSILVSRAAGTTTTAVKARVAEISADGRYVVYSSDATNVVASDTNGQADVFLFDADLGTTTLVSRNAAGTGSANGWSDSPTLSADGRFIAYQSTATNLVTNQIDVNSGADFFIYNRVAGTTALVTHAASSATTTAAQGSSDAVYSFSAAGGFFVYQSRATDLVTGQTDTNGEYDVFLFDTGTGLNTLVSHTPAASPTAGNFRSELATISANGDYVSFESDATNLIAGVTDTNSSRDVYLYTRAGGGLTLVSHGAVATTTASGRSNSSDPISSFSADGRYLVYTSEATDLIAGLIKPYLSNSQEVYRYDRTNNTSILVSRAAGTPGTTPDRSPSRSPTISADGRYVAFESFGANLLSQVVDGSVVGVSMADNDGQFSTEVYLFDADLGTTALVNRAAGSATGTGNGVARYAQVSSDGAYVTYDSGSSNLLVNQFDFNDTIDVFQFSRVAGTNALVSRLAPGGGGFTAPGSMSFETAISGDGRYVAFSSSSRNLVPGLVVNGSNRQIFRWDRTNGAVILVSRAFGTTTTAGDGYAEIPWISNDGRFIAYEADNSTNLVSGQTGSANLRAVFLFDAQLGTTRLVSHVAGASASVGSFYSRVLGLSGDGRYVFYYSNTNQAIAGLDNPGFNNQTYRWDRLTDTTLLVSHAAGSPLVAGDGSATGPLAISGDGRFVAFPSSATNLVAGQNDGNFTYDVFLRDCQTGAITLVSHAGDSALTTAAYGSSLSLPGRVSDDGRYVAYYSSSTNLIPGFTPTTQTTGNIFLFDAVAGTSSLVTHALPPSSPTQTQVDAALVTGTGQASDFALSSDGRYVVFKSTANNLVTGQIDTNGTTDLFVYDRQTTVNTLVSRAAGTTATAANFGIAGNSGYQLPMTRNGRYVAFSAVSTNLVNGVTPTPSNDPDVYVADLQTGVVVLASRKPGGGLLEVGGNATVRLMAADAPVVLFSSTATTLIGGNYFAAGEEQLYVYEADLLPPTVAISAPSAASTTGASVSYTITYTDAASINLSPVQVVLNASGGAGATVIVSGAGTTTRTVTLSAFTGSGTVGISLMAGTALDGSNNSAPAAGPSATIGVTTMPPAINTHPAPFPPIASIGGTVTLNVGASSPNSGTLTYQWRKFGQPIADATNASLTVNPLTPFAAGLYDVVVANNGSPLVSGASRLSVGPATGLPAVLTAASAFAPRFETDGGTIAWMMRASDGMIYLAGDFTSVLGTARPGLARLLADGTLDPSWAPPPFDGDVRAFAVQSDGKVIVGGEFETVGGYPRHEIARLNVDGSFDPTFAAAIDLGRINALLVIPVGDVNQDKIIVGGHTNGSILRLNANGTRDTGFAVGGGASDDVMALVRQSDGKIIVGGEFSFFNGVSVNGLVRLETDGTRDATFNAPSGFTGSSDGEGGSEDPNVYAMALQANGRLIIGGAFQVPGPGESTHRYIARLTSTGAVDPDFNPGSLLDGEVNSVDLQSDGKVLIAGSFSEPNLRYIGRLLDNGTRDTTFATGNGFDSRTHSALRLSDGKVLVDSGWASAFNGTNVENLVRLTDVGVLDGTFVGAVRVSGTVYAVAPAPGSVPGENKWIVGGDFQYVNGLARSRLARLNSDLTLDVGFMSTGTGFGSTVNAVAVQPDGRVIAGGYFQTFNGSAANWLVRLDNTGARDATFVDGYGFNSWVNALALQADGRILVGGTFNGNSRQALVRLNASGALDPTFTQPGGWAGANVSSLLVAPDGDIYAGGYFADYNGTPSSRLIRFNGDGTRDGSFDVGYGFNGGVNALALQPDGKLVVGGEFSTYQGDVVGSLTRLLPNGLRDTVGNGGSGFAAYDYNFYGVFAVLVQPEGEIVAGGSFDNLNSASGSPVAGVARFIANGMPDVAFYAASTTMDVKAMQFASGGLLVGGTSLTFPNRRAAGLALLEAAPVPVISTQPIAQTPAVGATNVSLSVGTSSGPNLTYQWRRNGILIAGASGSTLTFPSIGLADAGSYTVTVSNVYASVTSNAATLTGTGTAPVITGQVPSVTVTSGSSATLTVTATGATNYQWRKLGVPIAGATNTSLTFPSAALSDAALYDVLVGNGLAVTTSAAGRLQVLASQSIQNPLVASTTFGALFEAGPESGDSEGGHVPRRVLVEPGGTYYVAGEFTSVNGSPRRGLARFLADGTLDPGFNVEIGPGAVLALARQPSDGRLVIGGFFTHVNGLPRHHIARLNANGTLDTTFNASNGFDGTVHALAVQPADGKIIAAGEFSAYGASAAPGKIARISADGATLDAGFAAAVGAGFNGPVYALALHTDGTIYAGGGFTLFGAESAPRLARLEATGSFKALSGLGSGFDSYMYTLVVLADGRIYAGGHFTTVNGTPANYVARLDATGALDTAFNANLGAGFNGVVNSLAVDSSGNLIAGGSFYSFNNASSGCLVRLTSTGTRASGFPAGSGGVNDVVLAVGALADGDVLAVGDFTTVSGVPRLNSVRLNSDGTLDPAQVTRWGKPDGRVTSIIPAPDNKWLVAGRFDRVNGALVKNIIRLNADGSNDPTYYTAGGPTYGTVNAVAYQGDGKILVGGDFNLFENYTSPVDVGRLVRLNPNGTIDFSFDLGDGFDGAVHAIAVQADGKILVGGTFSECDGVVVNGLARLLPDGSLDPTFVTGTGFSGDSYYVVRTIVPLVNGRILVGGNFYTYNNVSVPGLIRLHANGVLDPDFSLGTGLVGQAVLAILVQPNGQLLVGGHLGLTGSPGRWGIARLNDNGSLDTTTFNPSEGFRIYGEGLQGGTVTALALQADGKIVAAGHFSEFNGVARGGLARLNADGTLDTTLAEIVGADGSSSIAAVGVRADGRILVGGEYFSAGGITRQGLLLIEGAANTTLPTVTGFNPGVLASGLAVTVTGANFTGATAVRFNGVNAASFTVNSATQIVAIAPPGVTGGVVSVTTPAGTGASSTSYTTTTAAPTGGGRALVNLSTLTNIGTGNSAGLVNFTIEGTVAKTVLVRAVGPTLGSFSVVGLLADPKLELFNGQAQSVAQNDDWGGNAALVGAASAVNAFPLLSGSKDAAAVVTLNPGTYTLRVEGVGGSSGNAMLQVYDTETALRIPYFSFRQQLGAGSNVATVGFVLTGGPQRLLIRGLGPALVASGVAGALANPTLKLFGSGSALIAANDNWGTAAVQPGIAAAAATAGLLPLADGSNDAALLVDLASGNYTIQVTGVGVSSGITLIEIAQIDSARAAAFAPAITYLAPHQKVLAGQSATFGVAALAKPAATYQWRKYVGGIATDIPGATGAALTVATVNNPGAAEVTGYDVIISNVVNGVVNTVTSPVRMLTALPDFHSADTNRDRRISVAEVTRVIQLYNYRSGATRTGDYHVQSGTEDGFAPGPGAGTVTTYHSADYNRDGRIDAGELLRVIELFNQRTGSVRTGEHRVELSTEDGFVPVLPPTT